MRRQRALPIDWWWWHRGRNVFLRCSKPKTMHTKWYLLQGDMRVLPTKRHVVRRLDCCWSGTSTWNKCRFPSDYTGTSCDCCFQQCTKQFQAPIISTKIGCLGGWPILSINILRIFVLKENLIAQRNDSSTSHLKKKSSETMFCTTLYNSCSLNNSLPKNRRGVLWDLDEHDLSRRNNNCFWIWIFLYYEILDAHDLSRGNNNCWEVRIFLCSCESQVLPIDAACAFCTTLWKIFSFEFALLRIFAPMLQLEFRSFVLPFNIISRAAKTTVKRLWFSYLRLLCQTLPYNDEPSSSVVRPVSVRYSRLPVLLRVRSLQYGHHHRARYGACLIAIKVCYRAI